MRRTLVLLSAAAGVAAGVLLLWAAAAGASPADPAPRTLTQPDGSTFEARLYGDEYVNGFETLAGYTVVRDGAGAWTFAEATTSGRLAPSGIRPGGTGEPPAAAELTPHLRDEVALAEAEDAREQAAAEATTPPATGTQEVLVVLVEFTDRSLATTDQDWADLFFGADQSVADFYAEASYGALDLEPATETGGAHDDGVVRVALNRTHPATGSTNGFQPVVRAALQAADAVVDFSAFDDDHDMLISADELHLAIVPAGTEAAQGCAGPSVWGHRSGLGSGIPADDVTVGAGEVGGYFIAGELQCDGPEAQATLGIWVHELGHDLGWNDLYDTDGSSRGVDTWSVMGIHWLALDGERNGTRPPLPDPFSRSQVGWLTPEQVTVAGPVELTSSASPTTPDVIQVLDNPGGVDIGFLGGGGTGEYFLVENRVPEGYDIAVRGCGALVWHIDETRWSNSDDGARLVDVEEAGEGYGQDGSADAEDPYPSEHPFNDTFGPNTAPDSSANSGLPTGVTLTAPSGPEPVCGDPVTLDVDPGTTPLGRPANDRLANARVIPLGDSGTTSLSAHNVGATHQPGEPRHDVGQGSSSVWFSFRPPRAGFVNVTTSSTFREVAAIYTGPHVGRLTRVESVRGVVPDGGAGSPPAPESINRGLGVRVERHVRYLIAVDSAAFGDTGGLRLFLDYDQARPDARPVRRFVAPGERPVVRMQVRNTSTYERLRVTHFLEGGTILQPLDCPRTFVLQPGESRTCRVRPPVTGGPGARLRGKVTAWVEWVDSGRFAAVADPWFTRVRAG